MNTERGRVSNLLSQTRNCMAAEALAKAQALGRRGCGSCTLIDSTINKPVQTPSAMIQVKQKCFLYQSPESGVPESVRLARLEQRTLDLAEDPSSPDARFSEFRRPFIQVCPTIPAWYYTAGEPKLQGKNCPLPNKPDNPVLPG